MLPGFDFPVEECPTSRVKAGYASFSLHLCAIIMCPGLKKFGLSLLGTETHAESSIMSVTKTWHAEKSTSKNQTLIFSEMMGKNLSLQCCSLFR
jgi:hypothetical protein